MVHALQPRHSAARGGGSAPDANSFPAPGDWSLRHGDVMKVRAALCGFFIFAAILSLGAGERITMQVSPRVSLAPANLVVRTMIEANESNRALEIVAESGDFYRSSQI